MKDGTDRFNSTVDLDSEQAHVSRILSSNPQVRVGRKSADEVRARQMNLVEAVRNGISTVEGLSRLLQVSPGTIRRDLDVLASEGLLARTYGGAVLRSDTLELPFSQRQHANGMQKMAIAQAAASIVEDGEMIILDGGSTTGFIARLLRGRPITVVTIGINSLLTLFDSRTQVVVLGGSFVDTTHSLLGPIALRGLRELRPDRAFLSAAGVSSRGLHSPTSEQATMKSEIMQCSRRSYIVVDSSKFSQPLPPYLSPVTKNVTLITDPGVSEPTLVDLGANAHIGMQITKPKRPL